MDKKPLISLYKIDTQECLHPDDVHLHTSFMERDGGFPSYFKVGQEENGYVHLQHGSLEIRVKNECVQDGGKGYPEPMAYTTDQVILKKYPDKIAYVIEIGWHYAREEYIYSLKVDGKRKSKWYVESDFIRHK